MATTMETDEDVRPLVESAHAEVGHERDRIEAGYADTDGGLWIALALSDHPDSAAFFNTVGEYLVHLIEQLDTSRALNVVAHTDFSHKGSGTASVRIDLAESDVAELREYEPIDDARVRNAMYGNMTKLV